MMLSLTVGAVLLSRWTFYEPHYHVHLAIRAEQAGRDDQAKAQFDEARRWSRLWRSEAAALELFDAALKAQDRGELARRNEYLEVMQELSPPGFYDRVVQWRQAPEKTPD
jgi:hypothetical protein